MSDLLEVAEYDHHLWTTRFLDIAIFEGERCQAKVGCARKKNHYGVCVAAPPIPCAVHNKPWHDCAECDRANADPEGRGACGRCYQEEGVTVTHCENHSDHD